MQFRASAAHTTALTLEETIGRLASHPVVDGILLIGTTGTGELTPTSDYDLLLILDGAPVPLRMVNTWVEGRLTEIYCATVVGLARIADNAATWPDGSLEGAVVRWLQNGRIAHDRAGHLAQARSSARAVTTQPLPTEREIFGAWAAIGYDLAQTKRYLASDDPVAHEAADWRGEKRAIRYLTANDPDFLALLRRCLAESDRRQKVALYEELARIALAPVGGLWGFGTAVVRSGPGIGAVDGTVAVGSIEEASDFWQALTAG